MPPTKLAHLVCATRKNGGPRRGMDTVCPEEESERMRYEASGVASLVVFPEGNHVCDNIPYKVRPLMADWMARQLRAAAA